MLFNHVQIKVNDLAQSLPFYDGIMQTLSMSMVLNIENEVVGWGNSVHDMFEIRQATKTFSASQSVHLAFNAPNQKAVDNFYQTALELGATCNGKPGLRPQYEKQYYAAFVTCPNGHNLEAVYCPQEKQKTIED